MKKRVNNEVNEVDRKVKFNQTIQRLNEIVEKVDIRINDLSAKARIAKEKKSESSLKIAKVGLASALSTKHRAEQMIIQLDVMSSMSDITELTKDFLSLTEDACDDIFKFSKGTNPSKVNKKMTKAFAQVNSQSNMLNEMMEFSESAFNAFDVELPDDVNAEVDSIINSSPNADQESSYDDLIEKKLNQLK